MTASFGCVVLTGGTRPVELRAALDSLLRQRDVELDVVVVGNPWEPEGLPDGVRGVALPESVGIPAGRNAGVPHVAGELLFFLDDDACLRDDDALARIADAFAADRSLALLQPRVMPLAGGTPPRNWFPHLREDDRGRSGAATVVWEGAVAMRRDVFEEIGGWPADFHFVHEGVDLAWRVLDAGHGVRYEADVVALHPVNPPMRHGYSYFFGARNRVWLARRYLPLPLGILYVATFAARTLPGMIVRHDARAALGGYVAGLRTPCGPRRPLSARTLWRMTRAGRPPVI